MVIAGAIRWPRHQAMTKCPQNSDGVAHLGPEAILCPIILCTLAPSSVSSFSSVTGLAAASNVNGHETAQAMIDAARCAGRLRLGRLMISFRALRRNGDDTIEPASPPRHQSAGTGRAALGAHLRGTRTAVVPGNGDGDDNDNKPLDASHGMSSVTMTWGSWGNMRHHEELEVVEVEEASSSTSACPEYVSVSCWKERGSSADEQLVW